MNTRWHKSAGVFLWFYLIHLRRAARSAAPWFGSQSHSTAYPSSAILLILPQRFLGRRWTGDSIFVTSIFFQLSILIYYPQCGIHVFLIWRWIAIFIWHWAGWIWCGLGILHILIIFPPIFIDLIEIHPYGLIVTMAYPAALHKLLQGRRVWLRGQASAATHPFAADEETFLGAAQHHHNLDLCWGVT